MSKKSKELLMFKNLLPILFLFTGFQAGAVVIGNLTYDGTYISGDGRTYLGLETIASWDYIRTFNATQVNGEYEDYRIANTADADYFIGSLFGADADDCSTVDGAPTDETCGHIQGWTDGFFGDNFRYDYDMFMFIAEETPAVFRAGITRITQYGIVRQIESWNYISFTDKYADNGYYYHEPITWLLVKDTVASVPEPSSIALMGLGIFGLGYARRRRQS
jgi:hypothetical protein